MTENSKIASINRRTMGVGKKIIAKAKTMFTAMCSHNVGPNLMPAVATVNMVAVAARANNQA